MIESGRNAEIARAQILQSLFCQSAHDPGDDGQSTYDEGDRA
jgi:hypothetical protein